eukprot:508811_1
MPRPVNARHARKGRMKFIRDKRPITKIIRDRWYPFAVKKIKRGINNPTKLRKGLTPGTILVILTGPYRGRRVVYLKKIKKNRSRLFKGTIAINLLTHSRVCQKFFIV